MSYKGFRWEGDTYWWEMLRFDEMGLSSKFNFVVPDKLFHFLICFGLTWMFAQWTNRYVAASLAWFIMMGPWEIVWDGMFRYGASWRDMIANTLGVLICWWWLSNPMIGQQ